MAKLVFQTMFRSYLGCGETGNGNGGGDGRNIKIVQPGENRAFAEMMKAAREWLSGRDPKDIAQKAGIDYDEGAKRFSLISLGMEISISYPDYEMEPYLNEWQQLVILHYMRLADGTPLQGQWMTMGEVKDGLIRGGDFDRRCENVIRSRLSQIAKEELEEKCRAIGGKVTQSNADFTVRFYFLPHYPLLLKLWFADEEFPASGKLLLDTSADHYLMIEDAVTVGQIIMEMLAGVF